MKALLIAEDDEVILNISTALRNSGYDVIVYRWLLKALDNVEEIAPDVVIISTAEYPRHWKTFAQFAASGIGGSVPRIILHNGRPLSEEDKQKARTLNVAGTFSGCDEDGLTELKDILKSAGLKTEISIEKSAYQLVFSNPSDDTFVTGSVVSYTGNEVKFKADFKYHVENLKKGMIIKYATFKNRNEIQTLKLEVVHAADDLVFAII